MKKEYVSYDGMKFILKNYYPDKIVFDDECKTWYVVEKHTYETVMKMDFPREHMSPREFEALVIMGKL